MEHALPLLTRWESFYVIVGSSAAALTGLQFVVIVLAAELDALAGDQAASAFGTPTVVHFCAALLLSAILSAPWVALSNTAVVLGVCGVAGVVYAMMAVRAMRRQTGYQPVLEDWIWHGALPFVAYVSLLATAILLPGHPAASLFGIGAVTLLLLFIGIHNAWDSVTYIALSRRRKPERSEDRK